MYLQLNSSIKYAHAHICSLGNLNMKCIYTTTYNLVIVQVNTFYFKIIPNFDIFGYLPLFALLRSSTHRNKREKLT